MVNYSFSFPFLLHLYPLAAHALLESYVDIKFYFTDNSIRTYTLDPNDAPTCRQIYFPAPRNEGSAPPPVRGIVDHFQLAPTDALNNMEFTVFTGKAAENCNTNSGGQRYNLQLPYYGSGWTYNTIRTIDALAAGYSPELSYQSNKASGSNSGSGFSPQRFEESKSDDSSQKLRKRSISGGAEDDENISSTKLQKRGLLFGSEKQTSNSFQTGGGNPQEINYPASFIEDRRGSSRRR
ncbi:hypothetical protein ABW19_dt0209028 [Dactylella cylindrospora]|nr:hypothetical protein ABW19_dt0209028 [Dactylella cylindrospora]